MPYKQPEEVHGIHANSTLLSMTADAIGREVIVTTRDSVTYEGMFAACSPQFEVGLMYAHELPADNIKKLLPHKDDITEKLMFDYEDIISLCVVLREEKRFKGFATDREYFERNNMKAESSVDLSTEFEVWEADEEDDFEKDDGHLMDGTTRKNGDGWSVDEMFHANDALGVKSTFDEDLSQYTTANVEGDSEARQRAERIAQEIEKSTVSKTCTQMENDDEERDLDKETPDFVQVTHRRSVTGSVRGNYSSSVRGGNMSARGAAPLSGRRSEGLPGSGRGRGGNTSHGSGGSSRSFTNSALSHSGRGNASTTNTYCGGGSSARYHPIMERPSAQDLHNQFDQWAEMRREGTGGGNRSGPTRRSDQSSVALNSAHRTHESNHRPPVSHHGAQSTLNRSADGAKGVDNSNSSHGVNSSSGALRQQPTGGNSGRGGQSERVRNLREFQQNFNSTYQSSTQPVPTPQSSNDRNQRTPAESSAPPPVAAQRPMNNAWNKGPPPNIRAPQAQASSKHISPTTVPPDRPQQLVRSKSTYVAQATASDARSLTGSTTSTDTSSTVTDVKENPLPTVLQHRSNVLSAQGPATTSAAASQAITVALVSRDAQLEQLAAAASSSSIAPTDPSPSSTVVIGEGSTVVTTSPDKKFEFNPDAPVFLPRTGTRTQTPVSVAQPQSLMPVPSAAVQFQSFAAPQGVPLAQTVQPGNLMVHTGSQQVFPYAPGNVYQTMPVYYNTQAVMQAGPPLAQGASAVGTATSVTGGSIVANTAVVPAGRGAQLSTMPPAARRTQQPHQLLQGASMYMSGQAFAQQVVPSQYQVPYFAATAYPQLPLAASASMPPPTVPPPVSNTVIAAGGPPPSLQAQTQVQHQQSIYPRQFYPGGQPVNYVVATRFSQGAHSAVDYAGVGGQQSIQHSQQASSTASSNGNSSNGHNSQPATPGPVTSPGQVQQQLYSTTGIPQSSQTVFVPIAPGSVTHNPQHLYVQTPQFPYMSQPGSYMVYGPPQQLMQFHPSAVAAAATGHSPFTQTHHLPGQLGAIDQAMIQSNANLQMQSGIQQHQAYLSADQGYGQYIHAQQQAIYHQQAQTAAAMVVRQNSFSNNGNMPPPNMHQPYQSTSVSSQASLNQTSGNNQ